MVFCRGLFCSFGVVDVKHGWCSYLICFLSRGRVATQFSSHRNRGFHNVLNGNLVAFGWFHCSLASPLDCGGSRKGDSFMCRIPFRFSGSIRMFWSHNPNISSSAGRSRRNFWRRLAVVMGLFLFSGEIRQNRVTMRFSKEDACGLWGGWAAWCLMVIPGSSAFREFSRFYMLCVCADPDAFVQAGLSGLVPFPAQGRLGFPDVEEALAVVTFWRSGHV